MSSINTNNSNVERREGAGITDASCQNNDNRDTAGWWSCPVCTLLNQPLALQCGACGTIRASGGMRDADADANEPCDPPPEYAVFNQIIHIGFPPDEKNSEWVWEPFDKDCHQFYGYTYDDNLGAEGDGEKNSNRGADCRIGRIRQGDGRIVRARWRVVGGRSSSSSSYSSSRRRKRVQTQSYAEEQSRSELQRIEQRMAWSAAPRKPRKEKRFATKKEKKRLDDASDAAAAAVAIASKKGGSSPSIPVQEVSGSACNSMSSAGAQDTPGSGRMADINTASDDVDVVLGDTGDKSGGVQDPKHEPHYVSQATNQQQPHYLEERLGMTKAAILNSLPEAVHKEIHDVCWASWKDKQNKSKYYPALILSPFDLNGKTAVLDEWADMYRRAAGNMSPHKSDWKALIYWYSKGYSIAPRASKDFKAFSVVNRGTIIDFGRGLERNYHMSEDITSKIENGELLSTKESAYKDAVDTMLEEVILKKSERGGPMFFPHLRNQKLEQARRIGQDRERRRAERRVEKAALRSARRERESRLATSSPDSENSLISDDSGATYMGDTRMVYGVSEDLKYSLELCSGEARMSDALRYHGFKAHTLDNSKKKTSDSSLSLQQLDERFDDGSIGGNPFLDHSFDFIWAGPECRTWSKAATTRRYRTDQFIHGIPGSATEADALGAEDDIEALISVLLEYQSRNPNVLMCIENPDGYLPKHPVSQGFSSELGLSLCKISYCFFGSKERPQPQKNTALWTNSKRLIKEFGNDGYLCKGDCNAVVEGDKGGWKHMKGVQDCGQDRCAAYPPDMCAFVARMVAADVREISRERVASRSSKRGRLSKPGSRRGSHASADSND